MIVASLGAVFLCSSGCVRRKVSITSTPSEALVWVNSQEVGRTPLVFEFTYDGVYDVRLMHEGCEALSTSASTDPPVWDLPGIDFFAEILPVEFTREVAWHFELEPSAPDPSARLEAAREMRASVESATPSWAASNLEFESAHPDPRRPQGARPSARHRFLLRLLPSRLVWSLPGCTLSGVGLSSMTEAILWWGLANRSGWRGTIFD